MIVVMKAGASDEELAHAIERIEALGYRAHVMYGVERKVIGCLGDERGKTQLQSLGQLEGVEKVMPILSGYKLAGKQLQLDPTVVAVDNKGRSPTAVGDPDIHHRLRHKERAVPNGIIDQIGRSVRRHVLIADMCVP